MTLKMPTEEEIAAARKAIADEDRKAREKAAAWESTDEAKELRRRNFLPPEHPEHICGMMCDGQDGSNSYCARIRRKLFGNG